MNSQPRIRTPGSATDEAAVLPIGSLYHAAFGRHPFAKHEGFQRFGDTASLLVLLQTRRVAFAEKLDHAARTEPDDR
jgi:hypothetical protein